jgi:peptide/nickel transport system permease protein
MTVAPATELEPIQEPVVTDRFLFARHPLLATIGRRLLFAIPLLLLVTLVTFVLMAFIPGDAATHIAGPTGTDAEIARLRTELGLDRSLLQQYWGWLSDALRGDLGQSAFTNEQVTSAISRRVMVTVSLVALSLSVSLIVGVTLGTVSAVRRGGVGRAVDTMSIVGFAVPSFWLGAQLLVVFAVHWRLFPATGYVTPSESWGGWLHSLVLPVVALSFGSIAAIARQTRESMLDALNSEYANAGRACGLSPTSVTLRHALKNASIRIITILGLQCVALLGGTIAIETVFALPGMGLLAATSTRRGDIPMILGVALTFTLIVVLVNLVIDIAYWWINPRLRTP